MTIKELRAQGITHIRCPEWNKEAYGIIQGLWLYIVDPPSSATWHEEGIRRNDEIPMPLFKMYGDEWEEFTGEVLPRGRTYDFFHGKPVLLRG